MGELDGVAQLETTFEVPAGLRHEYDDARWLEFRLGSCHGLAGHHVLGAMRSSRAALVEHLAGTAAATERFAIAPGFKAQPTGNVIDRLRQRAHDGPPVVKLDCDVPDWLTDTDKWRDRCDAERVRYERVLDFAHQLSNAREQRKADVLIELAGRHDRVLAFDHHLITLAQLEPLIAHTGTDVVVATGADPKARKRVEKLFALTSTATAIAVPPRNAIFPANAGALNRSHRARQMIRSCSTCRRSGQGAFVLHPCRKAVGITLLSPPLH